jgi:hypothetical protein
MAEHWPDSDLEIEVEPLDGSAGERGAESARPPRNERALRLAITASVLIVALAVLAGSLLPLGDLLKRHPASSRPIAAATATAASTPGQVVIVPISGTSRAPEPVPTECPPGNPVADFAPAFGPGVGFYGLNVWMVGFSGPRHAAPRGFARHIGRPAI